MRPTYDGSRPAASIGVGTSDNSTPGAPASSSRARAAEVLAGAAGVELSEVPTPLDVTGGNVTHVGRLRADSTVPDGVRIVLVETPLDHPLRRRLET